jgi:hypothetical protein
MRDPEHQQHEALRRNLPVVYYVVNSSIILLQPGNDDDLFIIQLTNSPIFSISVQSSHSPERSPEMSPWSARTKLFLQTLLCFLVTNAVVAFGQCAANSAAPSITICSPSANSTVSAPVTISGTANSKTPVQLMQIYVDNIHLLGESNTTSISGSFPIAAGKHYLVIQYESNGVYTKVSEYFTVSTASSAPPPITVTVTPPAATLAPSAQQQFNAAVANSTDAAVNWTVDSQFPGDDSTGTITSSGLYTATATPSGLHTIVATSQANTGISGQATADVVTPSSSSSGVFTQRYSNLRQGANTNETILTPTNVNSTTFGKLFTYTVDGYVFGQPLYVSGVTVNGAAHNVLYVATEHDSVYAFDADGATTAPLWKVNFLVGGATTVPQADVGSTIYPEIGITSTPVIDPATNTIYVVAETKENGNYLFRLHALDISTGAEKFGGPTLITASVPGTGGGTNGAGHVPFAPKTHIQRAALTLTNGMVIIAWASQGDNGIWHGWVIAYSASTLKQLWAHNVTPNGVSGGIWMAGGGLAVDANGAIYYMSGNGTYGTGADYGDSFVQLNNSGQVTDYFTPYNQAHLAADDLDIASGGPMIPPDQATGTQHIIIGAGKDKNVYVVNRDSMGHFQTGSNNQITQELINALGGESLSQPAYWNGYVYMSASNDYVKQFTLSGGKLSTTPWAHTPQTFGAPSPDPVISSSGGSNGILWLLTSGNAGVLHAYDATNISRELYNSSQAGTRDALGVTSRFMPSTVFNGKVYVGLKSKVVAFGLLP